MTLEIPRGAARLRRASMGIALAALIGAGGLLALRPNAALAARQTTWYVAASAASNPACSAASQTNPFHTIAAALACARSGDTVSVGAGTFAGGFTIPSNIILSGAGANNTTISDASQLSVPEVTVAPVVAATIGNLAVNGAGLNGGIVSGSGSLTLQKVAVTKTVDTDIPDSAPVAVLPSSGNATLTVLDSTISGNLGDNGGGIQVLGGTAPSSASVINSTISGNQGIGDSGGIEVSDTSLVARDDTIAGNEGEFAGGLYVGASGTAAVTDSLIATNTDTTLANTADCWLSETGKLTDGGHNLIGVASPGGTRDCGFVNGRNGDLTGAPGSPLNPDLGSLANNGGPTQTQALLSGSRAIGAGNATDCEAAPVNDQDQRGHSRNANTRFVCDIGAYDTGGTA